MDTKLWSARYDVLVGLVPGETKGDIYLEDGDRDG